MAGDDERLLDDFYLAFENRFRGGAAEIAERLSVYLPHLAGAPEGPVVDLGCGRGEWLRLLRDAGHTAIGVDSGAAMVQLARSQGLEVIESEALAYLRTLDANTLRAVSAFHLVEHVPFASVLALLKETARVLRPGGVALIETPNPHNILVGACNFYNDPTHLRPIPNELLQFAAEFCGLTETSVLFLHEASPGHRVQELGGILEHRFNGFFYGPQDYALIARKPPK